MLALKTKMARRDVTEMSFAFTVIRQQWNADFTQREILEVNLNGGDVSVVTAAANPATSATIAARGGSLTLEQRRRRAEALGSRFTGPCLLHDGYAPEKMNAQRDRLDEALMTMLRARAAYLDATVMIDSDPGPIERARRDIAELARDSTLDDAERVRRATAAQRDDDLAAELARLNELLRH